MIFLCDELKGQQVGFLRKTNVSMRLLLGWITYEFPEIFSVKKSPLEVIQTSSTQECYNEIACTIRSESIAYPLSSNPYMILPSWALKVLTYDLLSTVLSEMVAGVSPFRV